MSKNKENTTVIFDFVDDYYDEIGTIDLKELLNESNLVGAKGVNEPYTVQKNNIMLKDSDIFDINLDLSQLTQPKIKKQEENNISKNKNKISYVEIINKGTVNITPESLNKISKNVKINNEKTGIFNIVEKNVSLENKGEVNINSKNFKTLLNSLKNAESVSVSNSGKIKILDNTTEPKIINKSAKQGPDNKFIIDFAVKVKENEKQQSKSSLHNINQPNKGVNKNNISKQNDSGLLWVDIARSASADSRNRGRG